MLSPARPHAGAVLVHGEAAEQPQDDAAAARRVDDAPALLRHQVLRLEQSVSDGCRASMAPCVPGTPSPEAPARVRNPATREATG